MDRGQPEESRALRKRGSVEDGWREHGSNQTGASECQGGRERPVGLLPSSRFEPASEPSTTWLLLSAQEMRARRQL
eukprot:1434560-Rhodomonas_salina.2